MLIRLDDLCIKYRLNLKGVLHIGAHECEEYDDYVNRGVTYDKQMWIEALPEKVEIIKRKFNNKINVISSVVSDKDNEKVLFNVTNNFQSSSILNMKTHLDEHPNVHVNKKIELTTLTVKSIYDRYKIDYNKYNFLTLDIQGAELLALKGVGDEILRNFDYIFTEVNQKELYENCALLPEIDDFLRKKGFERVEIAMTQHGWGDAFYLRRKKFLAFDIGSNSGMWTLSNINNYANIISIEPSKSTYNSMLNNTMNIPGIECLNYAICVENRFILINNEPSTAFYDFDINTLSTTNLKWIEDTKSRFYKSTQYKTVYVKTKTIDFLIDKYGIPDLIKIDVKGSEYNCIRSLTKRVKTVICFEWASETFDDVTLKCLDYLKNELGYNKFYIQYRDEYTFVPKAEDYTTNIQTIKNTLRNPKIYDFGMVWAS